MVMVTAGPENGRKRASETDWCLASSRDVHGTGAVGTGPAEGSPKHRLSAPRPRLQCRDVFTCVRTGTSIGSTSSRRPAQSVISERHCAVHRLGHGHWRAYGTAALPLIPPAHPIPAQPIHPSLAPCTRCGSPDTEPLAMMRQHTCYADDWVGVSSVAAYSRLPDGHASGCDLQPCGPPEARDEVEHQAKKTGTGNCGRTSPHADHDPTNGNEQDFTLATRRRRAEA